MNGWRNSATTTAVATFLTGRAAGVWRSGRELVDLWGCARRYEHDMSESERGRLISGWNEALRRTRSGFGG